MPENEVLRHFDMYITKANTDEKGVMRWSAVNSDTDYDSYQERMSLELYQDFLAHIEEEGLPAVYKNVACSDFWCGGMPYVSVSHYPDLNGSAVPGEVLEIYVDGNTEGAKLKAKGYLFDSPLGHSVYRSLKEDKIKPPEEKIRISIGFLDLAHRHGDGEMWVREGLYDICPDCLEGVGNKVYCKGYLVHLALTRVPVNKRTEMVLEEKSMPKKTRKDDAASIVGKELAEEIEAKSKISAQKSDVLIEMSEAETTEEVTEEVAVETPEVPAEEPIVEESEAAPVAEEVVEKNMDTGYNLPYGGAVSMKDAQKARETAEEMVHVMDMFSMFQNVAWNIIDRDDVTDKKAAFSKAVDEFKSMLAAKAMLEFGMVEKSEQSHELQPVLDALVETVDNSVQLNDTERGEAINPAMQTLGTAIMDYLNRKSVVSESPAQNENTDNLLENITKLIQPLTESVQELKNQVGVLEAKSNAGSVNVQKPRIPQPRTMSSAVIKKTEAEQPKPGSLKSIIRRSVGIEQ
jgi:hypothetical protein